MNWWRRLTHRGQLEEQLDKELRFHLEQHTADLIAGGLDAEEARRRARMEFGGPDQVKESCRDARGTRWLEDLWQDFRYTLRTLKQRPGFSAVALLTLALGTGATTVMFTMINGVLLRPLPFSHPEQLVRLQEQTEKATRFGNLWAFAYPNFTDCRDHVRSIQLAAWRFLFGGTLSEPGEPENIDARQISWELFDVLGIRIPRGRAFTAEEDRRGAPPVAILGYKAWQQHFNGSDSALGASIVYDGKPYTVVGIAPAGFRLYDSPPDLFLPIGQSTEPRMQNREAHPGIQVAGRLRGGASLIQARTELAMLGRNLSQQFPKSNEGRTFIADPLRPNVTSVRSTLWLLLGAVTLVLLIACANIASLLLARAVSRERELAMRVALGAGRARLVRQCLTESATLSLCGAALGVLLAMLGIRPFIALWPGSLPRAEEVHLDWRVLLFALGLSIATGMLFGLAPALRVPVRSLEKALRSGGRMVAGASRRLHAGFVAGEIALAVVLLLSAAMMGRTLLRLSSIDPGLDVRSVLTARTALSPVTMQDTARTRAAWQEVLESARRVPGVEAVSLVDTVPMRQGNNEIGYWTTPAEPPPNQQPLVSATCVTPDYLKVTGIRLRQGRFFTGQDHMGSEGVVVIDEVMAQQAYGTPDAVGRYLWIGMGSDPVRVIGVTGHVRYFGPAADDQAKVRAQLYYPFAQVPDRLVRRWSELMSLVVRTNIPPANVLEPLKRAIRGASRDQVLYEVVTMEQLAGAMVAQQRFLALLFGVFSALALLLACIGIYGVLAYVTSRRVPEFGVRMALGAGTGEVVWLVLRQSLAISAAGAGAGLVAAVALAPALRRAVAGMQPMEPATAAATVAVLFAAALIASWIPARRAGKIDPVRALHQE